MKINNLTIIFIIISIIVFIFADYIHGNEIQNSRLSERGTKNVATLKTSAPLWTGNFIIPLAQEMGYMKSEGLDIEFVDYDNDVDVVSALMDHDIDFAYGLASDFMVKCIIDRDMNHKIVLVTDYSNGGDAIVMRNGSPPLSSSKNKILAGYVDYPVFASYALSQLNATSSSIKYDDSASTSEEQILNFKNHKYDYLITFGPYIKQAVDSGGEIVYSSKERPDLLTDVVVFRGEYLDNKQDIVDRFVRAYYKAYQYWKNNQFESYRIVSKYMNLSPNEISDSLKDIQFLGPEESAGVMTSQVGGKSIYGHIKMVQMYDPLLVGNQIDATVLVDSSPLKRVIKEMSNKK